MRCQICVNPYDNVFLFFKHEYTQVIISTSGDYLPALVNPQASRVNPLAVTGKYYLGEIENSLRGDFSKTNTREAFLPGKHTCG